MTAQRQNPNLFCKDRRKDSAPSRVSIVHGFSPVPRGWIRHPPIPILGMRSVFETKDLISDLLKDWI